MKKPAVFDEKLVGELLNSYRTESAKSTPGRAVELEIRIKDVNRDVFESIYKGLLGSDEFERPTLECSINAISKNIYQDARPDDVSYIAKYVFDTANLEKPVTTYVKKARLANTVNVTDYSRYIIGLSSETASDQFRTSSNALLRFKVRVSFLSKADPGWRFDLTAVKQGAMTDLGNHIKDIKRKLFVKGLTPDNLLASLNFGEVDAYEVEIEHVGAPQTVKIEDLKIVRRMFSLINPTYIGEMEYQTEIYAVAEQIVQNPSMLRMFKQPTHRLKQLSNQVIALSKNTYYSDVFPPTGCFLTEKADGLRCIVSLRGAACRILLSDTMLTLPAVTTVPQHPSTVVDAELVPVARGGGDDAFHGGGVDLSGKYLTLHVFDCMVVKGENVTGLGFEERVKRIPEAVAAIIDARCGLGAGADAPTGTIRAKNFVQLAEDNLKVAFSSTWNAKHPYVVDGMIITKPGDSYLTTKNYKWKPLERTTIDFLAVKCPRMGVAPYLNKPGHELYLLFVGINSNMREKLGLGFLPFYRDIFPPVDSASYFPIQFSPSSNPLAYLYYHKLAGADASLDKKIIELRRDPENREWLFHGVREDRKMEKTYFGNDFKIAELTYLNYIDPFDIESLWMESSGYFTKSSGATSNIYNAPNKYKRFVVSTVLRDNLSNTKWIIDEASGRGADLHRYQQIGVENAIFMDVDPVGIAELVRRKFEFFAAKGGRRDKFLKKGGSSDDPKRLQFVTAYDKIHGVEYDKLIQKDVRSLTIHTMVLDLKTPADIIRDRVLQFGVNVGGVDGIVCNFALHYLCDTTEHLCNIIEFNSRMLKVGGVFIFTVMSGEKVLQLLRDVPKGGQWEVREGELAKYTIKRLFDSPTLAAVGQMISVRLPFTDQLVDEPLCNIANVVKVAGTYGFELESDSCLDVYLDQFKQANRELHDKLTADDIEYIKLHHFITLRKKREAMKKTGGGRVVGRRAVRK